MKIRKEDTVLVIAGKNKGKKGKILMVFADEAKVLVEGVNLVKRHVKPKKSGEKGQVVTRPASLPVSNIKLVCPKCGKAARIGLKAKVKDEKQKSKTRICKKCKQEI